MCHLLFLSTSHFSKLPHLDFLFFDIDYWFRSHSLNWFPDPLSNCSSTRVCTCHFQAHLLKQTASYSLSYSISYLPYRSQWITLTTLSSCLLFLLFLHKFRARAQIWLIVSCYSAFTFNICDQHAFTFYICDQHETCLPLLLCKL